MRIFHCGEASVLNAWQQNSVLLKARGLHEACDDDVECSSLGLENTTRSGHHCLGISLGDISYIRQKRHNLAQE